MMLALTWLEQQMAIAMYLFYLSATSPFSLYTEEKLANSNRAASVKKKGGGEKKTASTGDTER